MRQSEEDGFTDFVRAHSATLFRTAFLMTGDYQRAEDLLQTTLVRLYQRWPRVAAMDQPVGYARRVLLSQAASWWRRRSSHEAPQLLHDEPTWGGRMDEVGGAPARLERHPEPAPAAACGDGSEVLRGPERGRDRRDPRDGAGHRQESRPRRRAPSGGPARGARRRSGTACGGGDVMTLDQRLTQAVHHVADGVPAPVVDIAAVRNRARTTRRRAVSLTVTAVVVAVVLAGTALVTGRDASAPAPADPVHPPRLAGGLPVWYDDAGLHYGGRVEQPAVELIAPR